MLESAVLDQLRLEHLRISQLLAILEHEAGLLDEAKTPDYDIVAGIIDYFSDFPDRCHHPKEDAIYRTLQNRYPDVADQVGNLLQEHEMLAEKMHHVKMVIENILGDSEIPRSRLHEVISDFIESQRRHLAAEEGTFFRLAQKTLTADDWSEIEQGLSTEMDPLSESATAKEFESLRLRIIDWAKEEQSS